PAGQDPANYVLKAFAKGEKKMVQDVIPLVSDVVKTVMFEGVDAAMNKYNRKKPRGCGFES
ncbi:MAG: aminoacyl-tRNA hydrolase, partial [bacterium]